MNEYDVVFINQHEYVVKANTEEEALTKAKRKFEKYLETTINPFSYDVEIYTFDSSKLS